MLDSKQQYGGILVKMADERGRVLEQTESASSESDLRDRFAKQGFYVYSVRSKGLFSNGFAVASRRKKVKQSEFVIFNQQFFTLIHAGLPIPTALDLLAKRQRNPYFRSVLENVRERVKGGEVLSAAFAAQGVFPQLYNTTLVAGEKSGNLEEVLTRFIAFQRISMAVRKKLLVSLIYPALLIVLVTLMLTYLIAFVVPKFADLYRDLQAPLPTVTVYLIAFGQTVHHYFPFILLAVAGHPTDRLEVEEQRRWRGKARSNATEAAGARHYLAEVSDRHVCSHDEHPARRWAAFGAFP